MTLPEKGMMMIFGDQTSQQEAARGHVKAVTTYHYTIVVKTSIDIPCSRKMPWVSFM